jgi:hypothetical protein
VATAPHLGPDPFDSYLEELLADPAFVAELDETGDQLERGELELHPLDEARAIVERRIREQERGGRQ